MINFKNIYSSWLKDQVRNDCQIKLVENQKLGGLAKCYKNIFNGEPFYEAWTEKSARRVIDEYVYTNATIWTPEMKGEVIGFLIATDTIPEDQEKYITEDQSRMRYIEEIGVLNYETKSSETSPPSRYNSGSMILAMENAGKLIEEEELREQIKGAGIGTSATRAEIMKKLERIGYIAINTKTQIITPTEKGEKIYDIVFMSMPDMLNPKLTASWEKGLEMVSSKQIKPNEFMTKLEAYINSKIDKLVVRR